MHKPLPSLLVITEKSESATEALSGWPILRLGFRPFYLIAALFAGVAVVLWLAMYRGVIALPLDMPTVLWHAHEMLFGFAVAVIVGFLFTAVKAWTGLPTPRGRSLGALVLLWGLARLAPLSGSYEMYAALDVLFLPVVALILLRLLVQAGNKRNMPLISLLFLMAVANGVFHLSILSLISVPAMKTLHAQLALILLVTSVMAGRVVPMFTQNVIPNLSINMSPQLERAVLLATVLTLLWWVIAGPSMLTSIGAMFASVLHAWRLFKWHPWVTRHRPILWVLHVSYAWMPVGFGFLAVTQLGGYTESLAVHAFSVGIVGGLIMGMITRTARGHTGRTLVASKLEVYAYVSICMAAVVRVFMPLVAPEVYVHVIEIAASLWVLAFVMYLCVYGPWLFQSRVDGRDG